MRDNSFARKRVANDYIRSGLRLREPNEPIPFFCECDRADCFATAWLKGVAFDRIRGGAGRVLAASHDAELAA